MGLENTSRSLGRAGKARAASTTQRDAVDVLTALALALALVLSPPWAGLALANPVDPSVAAGAASFARSGKRLDIHQSTDKAIIDWRSFSIAAGEITEFHQPSSASIALNRVTGADPSHIFGTLRANGQIMLVNPNGVLFGAGSRVDVAGLVATTADIRDQDFLAGRYAFERPSPNRSAAVVNEGSITIADAGYAALVAPAVRNSGTITARLGRVTLGAAEAFALDLYGDNLVTFRVGVRQTPLGADGEAVGALVHNDGEIHAGGGTVTLAASNIGALVRSVVNTEGIVEANSIERVDGTVVLGVVGPGDVRVSGEVTARGGTVEVWADEGVSVEQASIAAARVRVAADVDLSGWRDADVHGGDAIVDSSTIDVSDPTGVGGRVEITGDRVALLGNTLIDASGYAGGGEILVGGDYQGRGETRTADYSVLADTVAIRADATGSGDGGRIIVWADDATRFHGAISARGGDHGGDGGFAEVSGKRYLDFQGTADLSAMAGAFGTLLLDPNNITIQTAGSDTNISGASPFTATNDTAILTTGTIETALGIGNVVVTTATAGSNAEDGDITINNTITAPNTANNLTLQAHDDIFVNAAIDMTAGTGALILTADSDTSGAGNLTVSAALDSSGTITLTGQNLIFSAAGDVTAGGNLSATAANNVTMVDGTLIDAGSARITVTATGGNAILGELQTTNASTTPGTEAVRVVSGGSLSGATTGLEIDAVNGRGYLQAASGFIGTVDTRLAEVVAAITGAGPVRLANTGSNLDVVSVTGATGQTVDIRSDQNLTAVGSIGGGDVVLVADSDANGAGDLTLNNGTVIGGGTNVTLSGDDIAIGGTTFVVGTGAFSATSSTAAGVIEIGDNAGGGGAGLVLDNTELGRISAFATEIYGANTHTGLLAIGPGGAFDFGASAQFLNNGAITVADSFVTGSGSATLSAGGGALTVNAAFGNANTSAVSLSGASATFAAAGDITANGNVTVAASAGAVAMVDGTAIDAGSGRITVTSAGGGVTLGSLTTTSAATAAGAEAVRVVSGGSLSTAATGLDVDALNGRAYLEAASGFSGTIDTRLNELVAAISGSGGVGVANLGSDLTLVGVTGTAGQSVDIRSDQGLTVTGAVDGGAITLAADSDASGASALTVNAAVGNASASAVSLSGASATFAAAGDITADGDVSITASAGAVTMVDGTAIDAGSGRVTVTSAGGGVTLGSLTTTSAATAAGAEAVRVVSGGSLSAATTGLDIDALNGRAYLEAATGISGTVDTRLNELEAAVSGGGIAVANLGSDLTVVGVTGTAGQSVDIRSDQDLTVTGAVDGGAITLAADSDASGGGDLSVQAKIGGASTATVALSGANAALTATGDVDASASVSVNAAGGAFTASAIDVGATSALTVTAGTIDTGSSLVAGATTLNGAANGKGLNVASLAITGASASMNGTVGGLTGSAAAEATTMPDAPTHLVNGCQQSGCPDPAPVPTVTAATAETLDAVVVAVVAVESTPTTSTTSTAIESGDSAGSETQTSEPSGGESDTSGSGGDDGTSGAATSDGSGTTNTAQVADAEGDGGIAGGGDWVDGSFGSLTGDALMLPEFELTLEIFLQLLGDDDLDDSELWLGLESFQGSEIAELAAELGDILGQYDIVMSAKIPTDAFGGAAATVIPGLITFRPTSQNDETGRDLAFEPSGFALFQN